VVTAREGLITLAEREEIIETRRRRAGVAADFWQGAVRYGRIIARLPFVRMVAVTGALAMDNVDEDGDIDYLIVTEPGRLWLSRAWCILLVRIAGMVGSRICPNYFLTTQALRDLQRSLYSAHEISQMIPISGRNCYQELRSQNRWVFGYLPNSAGPPRVFEAETDQWAGLQKAAEIPQRSRLGNVIESWEMNRKIRKFAGSTNAESRFTSDQCKGHFELHGEKTLQALHDRLEMIEEML
ncbi:MAG TPA: hypothetical protein VJ768_02615, partial [Anaerolineales bacterium]|nr:hypothetical protein [Anaerolineales bacterium]